MRCLEDWHGSLEKWESTQLTYMYIALGWKKHGAPYDMIIAIHQNILINSSSHFILYLFMYRRSQVLGSLLHDGTCIGVVVAEERGDSVLWVIRHGYSLHHIANVASGCPLVIGLSCIRIGNQIVWDVRPEFGSLSCTLHPLQHLVCIHIPCHSYSALLSDYLH